MKCHFVVDPEVGKVLIPGCYQVCHSDNIEDCTCPKNYRSFEREAYNKVVREMSEEIEYWKIEVERLNGIIEAKQISKP